MNMQEMAGTYNYVNIRIRHTYSCVAMIILYRYNYIDHEDQNYGELARTHHVAPLAVETSGAFGLGAHKFFTKLGRRLIRVTGDLMSRCHMIQQISVALQRGNTATVLGTIEQCNVIDINHDHYSDVLLGGAAHCLFYLLVVTF